jgi:HSP20 family molecular chaperone IbpA
MNFVNPSEKTRVPPGDERPFIRPLVDVVEDAEGITLLADLPGVGKEQLQLRVEGDQLGIEAEAVVSQADQLTPLHAEVTRQLYRRSFTLSQELDASSISAEMSNGTLRVRIPKAPHAQPRHIEVRVH